MGVHSSRPEIKSSTIKKLIKFSDYPPRTPVDYMINDILDKVEMGKELIDEPEFIPIDERETIAIKLVEDGYVYHRVNKKTKEEQVHISESGLIALYLLSNLKKKKK